MLNFLWPCMLSFRTSDLNNVLEIIELRFLKSKSQFKLLKISPFLSSVCPSICPSIPFPCPYPCYKVHIFYLDYLWSCPSLSPPLSFLTYLPSENPFFLASWSIAMATTWHHCAGSGCLGEHVMSLHRRQLPWLLRDLRKGFGIRRVPGNVPTNCNKEETFIYIFLFQGGLPVTQRAHGFMSCNVLCLGSFHWALGSCPPVSAVECCCEHQTTIKWRKAVLSCGSA